MTTAFALTGPTGPTGPRSFQSVDLSVWARDFLAAVDLYLTPEYAVPLSQLAGAQGATAGLSAIEKLISAKERLADAIAATQVQPIFDGVDSGLADAREAVRQRLLTNLSSAYATDAIVHTPVSVSGGTGPTGAAPRLAGQPVAASGPVGLDGSQPGASSGTGASGPPFSFSTTKVPLSAEASSASYLFNVRAEADHKNVPLELNLPVNEVEFDIQGVTGITGYQASSWLTLIKPFGPTGASNPAVEVDTTIGPVTIPVPLRSYPSVPTLVAQSALQTYPSLSGVPQPERLAKSKLWDYTVTVRSQSAEQDTGYLNAIFAARDVLNAALAAQAPDLFDHLAQFSTVYPEIAAVLSKTVQGAEAENAIGTFADLAAAIADTWQPYAPTSPTGPAGFNPPGVTGQNHTYRLETARTGDDLATLTITRLSSSPSAPRPFPGVALVGPEGSTALAGATGATAIVYSYPPGVPANQPLTQQFSFSDLDVVDQFNAWSGVAVTRNQFLVPAEGPAGLQTNPAFVYTTPVLRFINRSTPLVVHGDAISIPDSVGVTGPTQELSLDEYLRRLFVTMLELGSSPVARDVRVTAKYGYTLAGKGGDDALTAFVPILMNPKVSLDSANVAGYAQTLADQLRAWQVRNDPSTEDGSFSFDVTLFGVVAPSLTGPTGTAPPILELQNLQLPLASITGPTAGSAT